MISSFVSSAVTSSPSSSGQLVPMKVPSAATGRRSARPCSLAGGVVVGAEGRRHVHDAGTVGGRDEIAGDDDAVERVVGQGHDRRAAARTGARQLAAAHHALGRQHRALTEQPAEDPSAPARGHDQPAAGSPRVGVLAILQLGMHGGGDVRRERPRRRRPDDQFPARAVFEREGHEDRAVADLLVPLRQLVTREDGAAARAIGQDAMAAVQELRGRAAGGGSTRPTRRTRC